LLSKTTGPAGWNQRFKIKDMTLESNLACPVEGSAGAVEYFFY